MYFGLHWRGCVLINTTTNLQSFYNGSFLYNSIVSPSEFEQNKRIALIFSWKVIYISWSTFHHLQNLKETVEKTLKHRSTDRRDQWSFLHQRFPDGLYQVVIQGIRPNSKEASGVALDDIYLAPCDKLRKDVFLMTLKQQENASY